MNDDLSSLFEKLNIDKNSISPEMIDNIMNVVNNFSQSSTNTSSNSTSENNHSEIDMEAILKLKSILDKMKIKNTSPRTKLLQDLKPYLNDSKKNKVDQCMKIDKMLELLPLLGEDFNASLYSDNQALLFSLIALLF